MSRVEIEDFSAAYDGLTAVAALSATFAAGDVVALAGPNGAGKSTLLRAIAGLIEVQAGSVRLDGRPVAGLAPTERARRLAYLAPDGRSAWPMEARRIVALGRAPHLKPLRQLSEADEDCIDDALERAGAAALAARRFDTLSSGERARVLIARVLATRADVILLDEPTAALDPKYQLAVMEIARSEAARGALVIVAAHALELIARYADRVMVMSQGQLVANAPPEDALSEEVVETVFGIHAPGGIRPTPLTPANGSPG